MILDTPVPEFASRVLGQHYIVAWGDQRDRLEELCRLTGIEVDLREGSRPFAGDRRAKTIRRPAGTSAGGLEQSAEEGRT